MTVTFLFISSAHTSFPNLNQALWEPESKHETLTKPVKLYVELQEGIFTENLIQLQLGFPETELKDHAHKLHLYIWPRGEKNRQFLVSVIPRCNWTI